MWRGHIVLPRIAWSREIKTANKGNSRARAQRTLFNTRAYWRRTILKSRAIAINSTHLEIWHSFNTPRRLVFCVSDILGGHFVPFKLALQNQKHISRNVETKNKTSSKPLQTHFHKIHLFSPRTLINNARRLFVTWQKNPGFVQPKTVIMQRKNTNRIYLSRVKLYSTQIPEVELEDTFTLHLHASCVCTIGKNESPCTQTKLPKSWYVDLLSSESFLIANKTRNNPGCCVLCYALRLVRCTHIYSRLVLVICVLQNVCASKNRPESEESCTAHVDREDTLHWFRETYNRKAHDIISWSIAVPSMAEWCPSCPRSSNSRCRATCGTPRHRVWEACDHGAYISIR